MPSTVVSLLAQRGATLAYILKFEGYETAFTNDPDTAGIATVLGGTYAVKALLEIPPAQSRKLDILGHVIEKIGWAVTLKDDPVGTVVSMFADQDTSVGYTFVTANVDRDDTTIPVLDGNALPAAPGPVWNGHERITYTTRN